MVGGFVLKKNGITLVANHNPMKEQLIINGLDVEEFALPDLETNLPLLLSEFVVSVRKMPRVGKIYVTLPVDYSNFVPLEFVPEVNYPCSFYSPSSEICDGVDMVCFRDEHRRISDAEKGQIDSMVGGVLISTQQKDYRLQLKSEGYTFRTATINDAEQIAKVWGRVFLYNDDYFNGLTIDDDSESFGDENQTWVICENAEGIVGIGSTKLGEGSEILGYRTRIAEIENCGVLLEHRRKGVMTEITRLLTDIISDADRVAYAYCCTGDEGMHRVMAHLGMNTGISQNTNHLLLKEDGVSMPEHRNDIPYVNNVVWFLPKGE